MSNKEIGFLFRIAVSYMLDSTESVHLGEPDTVLLMQEVMKRTK